MLIDNLMQQIKPFLMSLSLVAPLVGPVQAMDKLLETPWWLYTGEHFSVATNIPDKGADLIEQLELFRAVVLQFTGLDAVEDRLPTRAVIFASRRDFARIVDRPNALGYTSTSLRNNRMVSSGGKLNVARRHVMFHEYVHYVLRSATNENHPSWYDEGLADMLSTVFERKGRVFIGSAPQSHLRFLQNNQLQVPISRIVHTDDRSDWHPLNISMFYATSWAMVNYIYADKSGRRVVHMNDYLARVQRGQSRQDAFRDAFAMSPRAMERKSRKHVRRRNRAFVSYPRELFEVNTFSTQRRLSLAEVAYELSYLAMFSNTELARKLVQETLQYEPHNTSLQTALAVTYQADQEYRRGIDLARRSLGQARSQGVENVVLEIDLADMLMVWNQDACEDKDTIAHDKRDEDKKAVPQDTVEVCRGRYLAAKEGYQRGLQIEPDNPELRSGLAWALLKLDLELPLALQHIEVALDYQPWSPTLQYRAGMIYKGKGQRDLARRYLRRALYWSEDSELRDDAAEALAELD